MKFVSFQFGVLEFLMLSKVENEGLRVITSSVSLLLSLRFYINGIRRYDILFCVAYLPQHTQFGDASRLLAVLSIAHSS